MREVFQQIIKDQSTVSTRSAVLLVLLETYIDGPELGANFVF